VVGSVRLHLPELKPMIEWMAGVAAGLAIIFAFLAMVVIWGLIIFAGIYEIVAAISNRRNKNQDLEDEL